MCAGCDLKSVAWLQPFLHLEGGAQNYCSVNPTGTQAGRLRRIRGSTNDSLYVTRLPCPPLRVDVANESAPESSACIPPMPVGASRESAFVSAACMSPPVPLSQNNLVQPSSVVMASSLELKLETAVSHPTPCDSSTAWIHRPQSISDVKTDAYAVEWDNFDRMMQDRASDSVYWPFWAPVKTLSMLATIASESILTCSTTAPAICPNLFGGNLLGSERSPLPDGWNPALRAYRRRGRERTCRREARDERGRRLAISYISTCAARTPPP